MNANRLCLSVSFLTIVSAMLTAQVRPTPDMVLLKHWPAPLYWQAQTAAQATAADPPVGPLVLVAITPCRVADTRASQGFPAPFGAPSLSAGVSRTFPLQSSMLCSIPAAAQAYSLNITVVPQGPVGFLTMYPTGQPLPLAATLVWSLGSITSNAAIVPGGTSGSVDVYANTATDLVIDINGYYAPPTGLLSGWQVVRAATDSLPASSIKTVFAICPAGKQVLGGGAVVGYQQGNNFPTDPNGILMESEPTGGYNGWQASGIDNTPGDQWAVIAYAICANVM